MPSAASNSLMLPEFILPCHTGYATQGLRHRVNNSERAADCTQMTHLRNWGIAMLWYLALKFHHLRFHCIRHAHESKAGSAF